MSDVRRLLSVVLGLCLSLATAAAAGRPTSCPAAGGWRFICGAQGAEDLVAIPGTRWMMASALNLGAPAPLKLVDAVSRTAEPLTPTVVQHDVADAIAATGCAHPPDYRRMSTDGLALRPGARGIHWLYAANHGDRRAIEIFRLDARGRRPLLAWAGCARMPPGTLPNAVAPLPDGGLLVVSFHDPDDPDAWPRMARGEETGRVLEWHPGGGFRALPGSGMSGGNGIAVSGDGATAYVSAWSARRLVILPLAGGSRREVALDFMPDNIHLLADGQLLVGGQRTDVASIARCAGPACPQRWVIARIDPARGTVTPVVEGSGGALIDYACGALVRGDTLFMTARGTGGIAYRTFPRVRSGTNAGEAPPASANARRLLPDPSHITQR